MKKKIFSYLFLVFWQINFGQNTNVNGAPFLKEILIQFPNVRDLTISEQEDEVYFTAQSFLGEISTIMTCKLKNGKWNDPQIVAFSGKFQDLEPFLSPDQLRLYFVSNRPIDQKSTTSKDYDIWFVERQNRKSNWSVPKNLGAPINTNEDEFYPSIAISNNLYFTRDGQGSKGKDDIFMAQWENNQYLNPISVSDAINTNGYEFNAFVAPNESFLIYTCYNRTDGFGSGDLYISYKNENAEWSTAKNLGTEINSAQMDYCPFVNLKTKKLYFTSKRSKLKKSFENNLNTNTFLEEVNQYENGLSRIYVVDFSNFIKPSPKN